jgi:hypothetical protein
LGLDFFIKNDATVDVEKGLIQIKQGHGNNVQVLPLNVKDQNNSLLDYELESCSFDDSNEDTIVAIDDE